MRTTILATLALAAGHTLAFDDARSALLLSETETASLSMHAAPGLKISGQTQFQYNLNFRDSDSTALDDPNDDVTLGFQMRRTRITLVGPVNDAINGRIQMEFDTSGSARILDAEAAWKISDSVSLRIGQQKVRFLREDSLGTVRMLAADFSVQNQTFGQSYSHLVEAGYTADNWRAWGAFSSGFSTRAVAFNDESHADYAFTGRAELRLGEAAWSDHNQFTSWRGGAQGGLLGFAAHYQSRGDTNPSLPDNESLLSLTADFGWVGGGWNAYASGVYRRADDGADRFTDWGLMAQAGVFVSDQLELFGRWDGVFVDSDRGADVSDFHTLTAGVNYYIIPESHAAKFTVNLLYYFDAVNDTGGVVSPSAGANLLADSENGQIGITAQLQLLF
ncbi:MAG: OprO/OprP family phosphate-selective porin [Phycisphaerales bacterium]|nr:hypothetical protein [Planctomycetota bacterium]MCH8509621.1 OprO/OprP family phosphate-selective porin [Phycisphaerales bacterium]